MQLTLRGSTLTNPQQLRTVLAESPDLIPELLPQLSPALQERVARLRTDTFGGTVAQQVALLQQAAEEIFRYTETTSTAKSRASTLGFTAEPTTQAAVVQTPVDINQALLALPESERTFLVTAGNGQYEWTLISPTQVNYRQLPGGQSGIAELNNVAISPDYFNGLKPQVDALLARLGTGRVATTASAAPKTPAELTQALLALPVNERTFAVSGNSGSYDWILTGPSSAQFRKTGTTAIQGTADDISKIDQTYAPALKVQVDALLARLNGAGPQVIAAQVNPTPVTPAKVLTPAELNQAVIALPENQRTFRIGGGQGDYDWVLTGATTTDYRKVGQNLSGRSVEISSISEPYRAGLQQQTDALLARLSAGPSTPQRSNGAGFSAADLTAQTMVQLLDRTVPADKVAEALQLPRTVVDQLRASPRTLAGFRTELESNADALQPPTLMQLATEIESLTDKPAAAQGALAKKLLGPLSQAVGAQAVELFKTGTAELDRRLDKAGVIEPFARTFISQRVAEFGKYFADGGLELLKQEKDGPRPDARTSPVTVAAGAPVAGTRYGPTAAYLPEDLATSWAVLAKKGAATANVTVPADVTAEVTRALTRNGLIPAKKEGQVAQLLRGIWFGRGTHVPAFFKSVLSRPDTLAKVVANLRGYNEIAEKSNFDPLIPEKRNRPEELLERTAVVGFFSREDNLRKQLFTAIELDLKDEGAARAEARSQGAPKLDVAVIGSGPTGTAIGSTLQTQLRDQNGNARVAVIDDTLQGTFRLGASWRLNSPSREGVGRAGEPGVGDINFQGTIASTSDAQGGFWASADTAAQAGAIELFFSGVPVDLSATMTGLRRAGDGYEMVFSDGVKQPADMVVLGAGLGRKAKRYRDEATNAFVDAEYAQNNKGTVGRAYDFLYADSLQLFELTQGLNVPLAPFAPSKEMTLEQLKALDAVSSSAAFKTYLRETVKLAPSQSLDEAKVRPQQVVGLIGSGDGGNTVAELLALLGPTREADRTPAQLGIRPQVLWFVGESGPKACVDFYIGQLAPAFESVQKLFSEDPELKNLGIDVFGTLRNKALEASSSSDPQTYLTGAIEYFGQFLGVYAPREFIKNTFPNLTPDQQAKVEGAFLKARGAVRPRYNQLVQPIGKGQLKLVTDRVEQVRQADTPLGRQVTLTGAKGETYLVDKVIATLGNENETDEVIKELVAGKKGKLPVLKDPNMFEYIQVTDSTGKTQVVGKRLIDDPKVLFFGPGAIADYQANKTAVGANTVSIFLNKPLNDLAGAELAQVLMQQQAKRTPAENDARLKEDTAFQKRVQTAAAKTTVAFAAQRTSRAVQLPPVDTRAKDPIAEGGPLAFDVAFGGFLGRLQGPANAAFSISFTRGQGDGLTLTAPTALLEPLNKELAQNPVVAAYVRALPENGVLQLDRSTMADGRVSLERNNVVQG